MGYGILTNSLQMSGELTNSTTGLLYKNEHIPSVNYNNFINRNNNDILYKNFYSLVNKVESFIDCNATSNTELGITTTFGAATQNSIKSGFGYIYLNTSTFTSGRVLARTNAYTLTGIDVINENTTSIITDSQLSSGTNLYRFSVGYGDGQTTLLSISGETSDSFGYFCYDPFYYTGTLGSSFNNGHAWILKSKKSDVSFGTPTQSIVEPNTRYDLRIYNSGVFTDFYVNNSFVGTLTGTPTNSPSVIRMCPSRITVTKITGDATPVGIYLDWIHYDTIYKTSTLTLL